MGQRQAQMLGLGQVQQLTTLCEMVLTGGQCDRSPSQSFIHACSAGLYKSQTAMARLRSYSSEASPRTITADAWGRAEEEHKLGRRPLKEGESMLHLVLIEPAWDKSLTLRFLLDPTDAHAGISRRDSPCLSLRCCCVWNRMALF